MKKWLLCSFITLVATLGFALTSTVNGITWTYQVSSGKASITNCPSSTSGAITIPSTLGGYPVTSIGDDAFQNCSSLTSVTIPSSVTSIGDYAFRYCSSLTSVTIPEGVTSIGSSAFSGCRGLTSVTIPSSVTSIGSYAFSGAAPTTLTTAWLPDGMSTNNLKTLIIPEGVTSIKSSAFSGCSSLTSVTIPSSVTSIWKYAFEDCSSLTSVHISDLSAWCKIAFESECSNPLSCAKKLYLNGELITNLVIPSSVTSIGRRAFSNCSSLTSVTIPSSVTTIGYYAFYNCTSLTSVTIPSSVTSIGDWAFDGCSNLKITVDSANTVYASLDGALFNKSMTELLRGPGATSNYTIPSSVTSIGGAFYGCESLTSVTIPSSVTTIGYQAFYNCSSLTSVAIPSSVTSIESFAFYGCESLTSVTIPEGVTFTFIGDYAFCDCSSLISVTIPEGVTSIGEYVFSDCSSLTSVTIPESVTSIEEHAFWNCSSLTSVTIPSSVTSIGWRAFYGCSRLTSVDFKGEPPSVGSNVFYDISSSATGSYLPQYASEWESVIDANGKWDDLTMVQKEVATLPEGLPEATGEWLTDVLEASAITSGSAVLAEGTTVEALEAARLLGITPSVSVSGNIATVAAESTFEVSEVVLADNAVSLSVTIAVGAGELPETLTLGGAVKLMVSDTLDGEWTEVTPAPSQIKFTRVSENKATLSVTQASGSYKFFQVLVK